MQEKGAVRGGLCQEVRWDTEWQWITKKTVGGAKAGYLDAGSRTASTGKTEEKRAEGIGRNGSKEKMKDLTVIGEKTSGLGKKDRNSSGASRNRIYNKWA